jgi:hypothetical protein
MRTILVEYDRTRRVDKNFDKFRRYDAFLCWWSRHTPYGNGTGLPFVVFVCQTPDQRQQFLATADHELSGHLWPPHLDPGQHNYAGRRRILFALEHDAHDGLLEAWQLPVLPPTHTARDTVVQRVLLGDPSHRVVQQRPAQLTRRCPSENAQAPRSRWVP